MAIRTSLPRSVRQIMARASLTAALGTLACSTAFAQQATNEAGDEALEELVVTGTSIRGAAPVGANLITVDREAIAETGAQTMQQILNSVPSVTGFGNPAQGAYGSNDATGAYAPTIHGLGASASNGTLVLIDGNRLPLEGVTHTVADPNIIAPLTIDHIEVLPDGASSTYGSDAVAGVINIITRHDFKGFEATGQAGYGNNYNTQDGGFLWGDVWDQTSAMLSYNYERRSALNNSDRDFTRANHTAAGGQDFASYNCAPASDKVGSKYFLYPYTGAAVATAPCDFSSVADLLPEDIRNSFLVKLTHEVNERLSLKTDLVYSDEQTDAQISRGTLLGTAYGPGSTPPGGAGQINPFFQGPPGATSETIGFDADSLLGTGAKNEGGLKTLMSTSNAQLKLGGDWLGTLGLTFGQSDASLETVGALCSSCGFLGLNGTTNSSGNVLTPSIPGTSIVVKNLPLTTANALDVWGPAGANRTSAAVLSELTNSTSDNSTHQTIKDVTLKFDGSLFALPGGSVKGAAGGEYIRYNITEEDVFPNNTGPGTAGTTSEFFDWGRSVKSGYAELLVPVVGAANTLPLVQKLDLDISGRYDDYSDFGSTSNPKFALSWQPIQSVNYRADFARSFTAPALTNIGQNGVSSESNYSGTTGVNQLSIPNTFPNAIGLPGCTAATPTCTIGTPAVTGMQVNGPNAHLRPERGRSWSTGLDFTPEALPGMRLSATYWNVLYTGLVTAPQAVFAVSSPTLSPLLTLYPGGATAAQIATLAGGRPLSGALPPTVYYIYDAEQQNALNLRGSGLDADVSYKLDSAIGQFNADLAGSTKLTMQQQFGTGGEWFSILNTSGFNTSFPSNKTAARLTLAWKRSALSGSIAVNYEAPYKNYNGAAPYPIVRDASFSPIGGGQPIPALATVDLHAAYNFGKSGAWANTEIDLTAINIANTAPPFFNTALGYDIYNGNPIGRVVTLGVSKRW